jgi:protein-L-isoaspartate(D-aspartate) O-methyltransferase
MSDTTLTRDTRTARKAMIDSQLRTSGVNEEFILARMSAVPREEFLPAEKAGLAYIDRSVHLGASGHLASPLFYGKLLLEAAPLPDDRVLLVDGGTGYLGALIGPLVSEVSTIPFGTAAEGGVPEGDFSLVLVDGAIEQLPVKLAGAISEGGRIVSGLVLRKVTRLASGRKIGGKVTLEPVEDLGIPVIEAFNKPQRWTFS